MKAKTKREEAMLQVIEGLVKDRAKHPLPKEWSYGEEHPRYGEVIDILKKEYGKDIVANGLLR